MYNGYTNYYYGCNTCHQSPCNCTISHQNSHCNTQCTGCKEQIKDVCVFYSGNNLSCLGITTGATLNTIINAINTKLCTISPPTGGLPTLAITDSSCNTLFSYNGTSTTIPKKPTIVLNSNQNGDNNFSYTPASYCVGDISIDFDGRANYTRIAGNAPSFDFNIKGDRIVSAEKVDFPEFAFNTNPNSSPYILTVPKAYLGNSFNAVNLEELVYKTTILINNNRVSIPSPVDNYDTTVGIYLGTQPVAAVAGINISAPVLLEIEITATRTSNTTLRTITRSKLSTFSGSAGVTSGQGIGNEYYTSTFYNKLTITPDLNTFNLSQTITVQTATASLSGLEYKVLYGKVTLNKF